MLQKHEQETWGDLAYQIISVRWNATNQIVRVSLHFCGTIYFKMTERKTTGNTIDMSRSYYLQHLIPGADLF